jgi:hypothetical protein
MLSQCIAYAHYRCLAPGNLPENRHLSIRALSLACGGSQFVEESPHFHDACVFCHATVSAAEPHPPSTITSPACQRLLRRLNQIHHAGWQ